MTQKDHKIYGSVVVNTKGQIILPVEVRKEMGIKEGDRLLITGKWDNFIGIVKIDTLEGFINQMNWTDTKIDDFKTYKKK